MIPRVLLLQHYDLGPTAAKAIGDITLQQASNQKFGINEVNPGVQREARRADNFRLKETVVVI